MAISQYTTHLTDTKSFFLCYILIERGYTFSF
uniref:Uncharacterized protein n=1 Tax=Anguilla anguilla TaxID=7936 RepID=A0A0E9R5L9_ANGAN